jgi:hypothetical protein
MRRLFALCLIAAILFCATGASAATISIRLRTASGEAPDGVCIASGLSTGGWGVYKPLGARFATGASEELRKDTSAGVVDRYWHKPPPNTADAVKTRDLATRIVKKTTFESTYALCGHDTDPGCDSRVVDWSEFRSAAAGQSAKQDKGSNQAVKGALDAWSSEGVYLSCRALVDAPNRVVFLRLRENNNFQIDTVEFDGAEVTFSVTSDKGTFQVDVLGGDYARDLQPPRIDNRYVDVILVPRCTRTRLSAPTARWLGSQVTWQARKNGEREWTTCKELAFEAPSKSSGNAADLGTSRELRMPNVSGFERLVLVADADGNTFGFASGTFETPPAINLRAAKVRFSWVRHCFDRVPKCPTVHIEADVPIECSGNETEDGSKCAYVCGPSEVAPATLFAIPAQLRFSHGGRDWADRLLVASQQLEGYVPRDQWLVSFADEQDDEAIGIELSDASGHTSEIPFEKGRLPATLPAGSLDCGTNVRYQYYGHRYYSPRTAQVQNGLLNLDSSVDTARWVTFGVGAYVLGEFAFGPGGPGLVQPGGSGELIFGLRPSPWRSLGFELRGGYSLTRQPYFLNGFLSPDTNDEVPFNRFTLEALLLWHFSDCNGLNCAVGLGGGAAVAYQATDSKFAPVGDLHGEPAIRVLIDFRRPASPIILEVGVRFRLEQLHEYSWTGFGRPRDRSYEAAELEPALGVRCEL